MDAYKYKYLVYTTLARQERAIEEDFFTMSLPRTVGTVLCLYYYYYLGRCPGKEPSSSLCLIRSSQIDTNQQGYCSPVVKLRDTDKSEL